MGGIKKLGILGGTFDPPHIAHLVLADQACESLGLDGVAWVIAGDPPHKTAQSKTSVDHRLRMVELALAHDPRFFVSSVDLDRPGPHYTTDMLRIFTEQHTGADLFMLIGGDSLRDIVNWRRPAEIVQQAVLVVLDRPDVVYDLESIETLVPNISHRTIILDSPRIEISASDIRSRVNRRKSIRFLVPDAVREYINENGLYKGTQTDA